MSKAVGDAMMDETHKQLIIYKKAKEEWEQLNWWNFAERRRLSQKYRLALDTAGLLAQKAMDEYRAEVAEQAEVIQRTQIMRREG